MGMRARVCVDRNTARPVSLIRPRARPSRLHRFSLVNNDDDNVVAERIFQDRADFVAL